MDFWIKNSSQWRSWTRKNVLSISIGRGIEFCVRAEQLLKDAETQIAISRKEATEIVKSAQRKAEEEAHNLIKEARENRENILKTTELEITKIKNDAKEELSREVKSLAADLAEKIIKEKVDDTQEISLIDKFIAEVGEDK